MQKKTIITNYTVERRAYLEIFFEANELRIFATAREHEYKDRWGSEMAITLIDLWYDEEDTDTTERMFHMALQHSGFINMLDHYLMKLGIHYDYLHHKDPTPASVDSEVKTA